MKNGFLFILLLLSFFKFVGAQPKYEFRGAWIATVDNIDWPTKGNYNPESQRMEYIRLLDMHQRNGMNAVVVQVRPSTDAFYPSPFEPWSEWLTGVQGRPPSPYYDPLEFMIEETHKRGMEFHAWCNPYRAEFNTMRSSLSATHITKIHPEWFLEYGNKRYFDPGNKEAQQHVTFVISDLVKRYNIDAIHFDDYFYPYPVAGEKFPDDLSYARYGSGLSRDDWRRSNVDSIIVFLSRAIKEEKPFCKFGISPFGVWRNSSKDPEGSATRGGLSNYDDLYADILLWGRKGWIDYINPQLYWEFGHRLAPYETLIEWWSRHAYGRHLYIGHAIYRALDRNNAPWRKRSQLPDQIKSLREYATVHGSVYFSSKSFFSNPNGWNDSLQNNYYRHPAIIPPMPWIDSVMPSQPIVIKEEDGWKLTSDEKTRQFAIYCLPAAEDTTNEALSVIVQLIPAINGEAFLPKAGSADGCENGYQITAVSNNNIESLPVAVQKGM